MSEYLKSGGLLIGGLLVGLLINSAPKEVDFSGVYSLSNQSFTQGIKVGTTDQFTVSSAGAVTTSDDITTASDFVSTKAGLCFNFYATSTATLGKMTESTTATIEGVDGVMMFGYGSCQS